MKRIPLFLLLLCILSANAQTPSDLEKEAIEAYYKKDYKTALKKTEKAIKDSAATPGLLDLKANIYFKQKKHLEAVEFCTDALRSFPSAANLYDTRGLMLQSLGEFDLAIRDFTVGMSFTKTDSAKYKILNNRATAKSGKRDFNGAYNDLMECYKFDSTRLSTLTNLGAVCDEIGRADETLKYLLKAIEVDSTFWPAYGNIGFKYQEMGDYKKAIEYYNKVLEFDPNEPLGYSNRSFNLYKLGDLKGAMRDIEKSIKLYPANSYAYRIRALIYIAEGKTDKACEDLQTAINKGFTVSYGDEVVNLQKQHCK